MRDRYVCVGLRTGLFVHFKHVSVYFVFIVCLCVYVYATAWMWEPEGNWFSSTVWILAIKLRLPGMAAGAFTS